MQNFGEKNWIKNARINERWHGAKRKREREQWIWSTVSTFQLCVFVRVDDFFFLGKVDLEMLILFRDIYKQQLLLNAAVFFFSLFSHIIFVWIWINMNLKRKKTSNLLKLAVQKEFWSFEYNLNLRLNNKKIQLNRSEFAHKFKAKSMCELCIFRVF